MSGHSAEGGPTVEGVVIHSGAPIDGPRCYRHDVPAFHGVTPGGPGLPAHTWDVVPLPNETLRGCLRCGGKFELGDRYLCDEGGIIHVTCPPRILPPASTDTTGGAE